MFYNIYQYDNALESDSLQLPVKHLQLPAILIGENGAPYREYTCKVWPFSHCIADLGLPEVFISNRCGWRNLSLCLLPEGITPLLAWPK